MIIQAIYNTFISYFFTHFIQAISWLTNLSFSWIRLIDEKVNTSIMAVFIFEDLFIN